MKLSKIKEINLRSIWKEEEIFTKWLAEEENLRKLSDRIGISMKLLTTEAGVGSFSADILAEEENTGRKIIIENQLEKTDHTHLGQLLTYASGYDADIIIWMVDRETDEHRNAIDWLNEHTDEKLNLFIIKIKVLQIEDSPFAIDFQIISQPNDWARAIKESGIKSELSETKLMQLDFWNKFKEYAVSKKTGLKLRKAYPQHWYDISIGNSRAYISLVASPTDGFVRCSLYIPNSKETFAMLSKEKEKIEKELGEKLEWQELPESKASRIKIEKSADVENLTEWEKHFEWLRQQADLFQNVFTKCLNA